MRDLIDKRGRGRPSPACGRRWPRGRGRMRSSRRIGAFTLAPSITPSDPHPTRLRRATFSRKREKERARSRRALRATSTPASCASRPTSPHRAMASSASRPGAACSHPMSPAPRERTCAPRRLHRRYRRSAPRGRRLRRRSRMRSRHHGDARRCRRACRPRREARAGHDPARLRLRQRLRACLHRRAPRWSAATGATTSSVDGRARDAPALRGLDRAAAARAALAALPRA